jgi:hypothetical protein
MQVVLGGRKWRPHHDGLHMRASTFFLLSTLISSTAIAAEFSDHLRVDLHVGAASQPREGTLGTAQLTLAWEFRPGVSLEFWQARGQTNSHRLPTIEDHQYDPYSELIHLDIERVGGIGLRYDFEARKGSAWQPFVRAGWAHVSAEFDYPTFEWNPDGEFIGGRRGFSLTDDCPYLAIGSAYNFSENWNASVQLQYIAVDMRQPIDSTRTELLFGIGYRY